jgi:hypothetical protein
MSGCAYLMQVSLLFSVWYSVFSYIIELIVFYHNSCFDYYANIFKVEVDTIDLLFYMQSW